MAFNLTGTASQPQAQTFTFGELQQIWIDAGGDPAKATDAAAIAKAESDGNPYAKNTANKDGSTDYGLWQINSSNGPDLSKVYDPISNAKMAIALSNNGKDFMPWTTYWGHVDANGNVINDGAGNGAYTKYLPDGASSPQSWAEKFRSIVSGITGAMNGAADALDPVRNFEGGLVSIGALVIGVALLLGALIWASEGDIGNAIGNAADTVARSHGKVIATGAAARAAAAAAPEALLA